MKNIRPRALLLYSKTCVYKGGGGKQFFLIFDPKHRLLVLVRTVQNIECRYSSENHFTLFLHFNLQSHFTYTQVCVRFCSVKT